MAETDPIESRYDWAPYPALVVAQTHPGHGGAVARLLGFDTPDVEQARVLEIGCGTGANLITIARDLPQARLLGVDLSSRHIEAGRDLVSRENLSNVELRCADLRSFDPGRQRFDYIIAHGLFSWVEDAVKQRLLEFCRDHLTPRGIAYVSYNVYPGWFSREPLMQLMQLDAQYVNDPQLAMTVVDSVLGFFEQAMANDGQLHAPIIRHELKALRAKRPDVLFHDELGQVNDPCYFLQFVQWADSCGLSYLGDADFASTWPDNWPRPFREAAARYKLDRLRTEQHLDVFLHRRFRMSLLVRSDAPVGRGMNLQAAREMVLAGNLQSIGEAADGRRLFTGRDGATLSTGDPLAVALLEHLRTHEQQWLGLQEVESALRGCGLMVDRLPAVAADCFARRFLHLSLPPRKTAAPHSQDGAAKA